MSMIDEFGVHDDDTEFVAVATQLETMQNADFEGSPRPRKRQRTQARSKSNGGNLKNFGDSQDSDEIDDDNMSDQPAHQARKRKSQFLDHDPDAEPESDPDYYFPGEISGVDDQRVKNPKHRVHVPKDGGYLEKQVFAQTQVNLDSSPSHFRGPVWKQPAETVPAPIFTQEKNGHTSGRGSDQAAPRPQALKQTTLNGFSKSLAAQQDPVVISSNRKDNGTAGSRLVPEFKRVNHHDAPATTSSSKPVDGAISPLDELADLPSDAFSSSSPESSPNKEVIVLSSQPNQPQQQFRGLRGPQTGLKQMTISGHVATQPLSASQAANKRHAWPLKTRDEAPTHHKLDEKAMETWVYPINLGTVRDYQYNIVARSLFHNTLVALPTGLGKTFIAATVMLNYYRWTTEAQIVFMAPTKPLIAQQLEACYGIVGIPRKDTVLMTGETTPTRRAEEWLERRVFFMTPQTVINDLKTGICDPKRIVLLVVDEAHKASGGYAYTEVVAFLRRFNNSFRVQALTATPGSTVEAVQGVIDSLGIARVELRTEQSLDIRQYTHEKNTETEVFEWSDEQQLIMEQFSKALQPSVNKLSSQNAYWSKDPMQLNAFTLTQARQKWMGSDAGRRAPMSLKAMINNLFTVLSSLAHSIGLLKFHGIGPFYSGVLSFQRDIDSGQKKGKTVTEIAQSEHFTQMMRQLRGWTNNPDFVGHPKLEYLREVVLNHFLDAGEGQTGRNSPARSTRIMVFASYRDSTEEICRVLKRSEPMIRPHVFVGQAASKTSEGMDQKRQNAVIQDFKSGKYNTLVATSIGEEGLDIGDVDLIVCYDASSSPIRMLQRIGRTGRKRVGRVVLLLMKGKEENDYAKAQDSYAWIQKSIADTSRYTYREEQSPRILPKEVQPQVEKKVIDIPVENSQPIDLNEKGRKARGKSKVSKRPPKKFHMPDGVETGFVKASKMGSDDEGSEAREAPIKRRRQDHGAAPTKSLPAPPLDPMQLPFLDDVLLNSIQTKELERKYARSAKVDGDGVIGAPDGTRFPDSLHRPGPARYVRHGLALNTVGNAMRAMRKFDTESEEHIKHLAKTSIAKSDLGVPGVLVSPRKQRQGDKTGSSVESIRPQQSRKVTRKPRAKKNSKGINHKNSNVVEDTSAGTSAGTAKNRRSRKTGAMQRSESYGSAAAEGEESSPEPTPADMRIGTQGIDLGSRDTSGEDDDEEHDSELDDFVVRSDQPIEMASSSQRFLDDTQSSPPVKNRGRVTNGKYAKRKDAKVHLPAVESESEADEDPIDAMQNDDIASGGNSSDVEELHCVPKAVGPRVRSRRIIEASDSDE